MLLKKRATRKTPRECVPGIGPLKKGDLKKFGYDNVKNMSASERHAALSKAVASGNPLSIFRKLNALSIYLRKSSPAASAIFLMDRNWVREQYMGNK
jgi:hypothetical protein